jgi:cytochrome c553
MNTLIYILVTMLSVLTPSISYSLDGKEEPRQSKEELIAAGKKQSATCIACHNPQGNNPMWPKLEGQQADYLLQQLRQFKLGANGRRNNPIMYGIVANLTDQDLIALSEYYASMEPSPGEANPETLELGKAIYEGGIKDRGVPACMACHGEQAMGVNAAKFPRLAGQHAQYSISQLKAYASGERKSTANGMMNDIAKLLTEEEMRAVAEYVQGIYK